MKAWIKIKKVLPVIFATMFILSISSMASAYTSPNPWTNNNPTDRYIAIGGSVPADWFTLSLPDWYHDKYAANDLSLFKISMGGKDAYDGSMIDVYLRYSPSGTPTLLGRFQPTNFTSFGMEWNLLNPTGNVSGPSFFDGLSSFQIGYACHFTHDWSQVDIAYTSGTDTVPEPTTLLLLGLGLIGLTGLRKKFQK